MRAREYLRILHQLVAKCLALISSIFNSVKSPDVFILSQSLNCLEIPLFAFQVLGEQAMEMDDHIMDWSERYLDTGFSNMKSLNLHFLIEMMKLRC